MRPGLVGPDTTSQPTGRARAGLEPRPHLRRAGGRPGALGRRGKVARHRPRPVPAQRRHVDDAGVEHEDRDAGRGRRDARLGLPLHHDPRNVGHDRERRAPRRPGRSRLAAIRRSTAATTGRPHCSTNGHGRSGLLASAKSTVPLSATITRSRTTASARAGRGTICRTDTPRPAARWSSTKTSGPCRFGRARSLATPRHARSPPGPDSSWSAASRRENPAPRPPSKCFDGRATRGCW